ncbi:MAG: hypothetical protein K0S76_1163 [Herbinix sp.]|jgi:hypothetical protein|nr:hypothetical protein [Herbinix sp.]
MSGERLNLNKTVYELCSEYPELPQVLAQLGFIDITKPGMLNTVGRFMTLSKGAAAKKIDLEQVKTTLRDHGYEIED